METSPQTSTARPAETFAALSKLRPVSIPFRFLAGLLALLMVATLPVVCGRAVMGGRNDLGWLVTMGMMSAGVALIGRGTVGLWRGALIDQRNLMSLSRFQLLLWTLLILSSYLTTTLHNVFLGVSDPLAVALPTELWMLMGVSTVSLVGTPLLLDQKAQQAPVAEHVLRVAQEVVARGGDADEVVPQGQLMTNTRPEQADWTDLFTGEEAGNWFHVDVAMLQMFLFTLAVAMAYASALWRMFSEPAPNGLHQLPPIDASAVALLGISHAGFLVNKAMPRQAGK